jgi:hypothetical protein
MFVIYCTKFSSIFDFKYYILYFDFILFNSIFILNFVLFVKFKKVINFILIFVIIELNFVFIFAIILI